MKNSVTKSIISLLSASICAMSLILSVATPMTASAASSGVDMYRLYNKTSGEHFYTANAAEKSNLISAGWKYEGIGWVAPATSNTPVYRLYNPNSGNHHYTVSVAEKNMLTGLGWKYEGIGWYSDDSKRVPLYREYNPNAKTGSHNYTTSAAENAMLTKNGWKAESIGWYGVEAGHNDDALIIEDTPANSNATNAATTSASDTPTTCDHDWVAQTKIVHHDAVTHEEKVVDKPATKDRIIVKDRINGTQYFDNEADATAYADWMCDNNIPGDGYGYVNGSPEKSHMETVVDKPAWNETVTTGYVCSKCGATK